VALDILGSSMAERLVSDAPTKCVVYALTPTINSVPVHTVRKPGRGRCLIAAEGVSAGATVLEEMPLIALPLPDSTEHALLCDVCLRDIGSPAEHIQHAAELDRPPVLPIDGDPDFDCRRVECSRGCDAQFCSRECEALAQATFHGPLCPGAEPQAPHAEAVEAFLDHAHGTDEAFLLGGRLVALVLATARREDCSAAQASLALGDFCRVPYWELPKGAEARAACRDECATSLRLLRRALDGSKPARSAARRRGGTSSASFASAASASAAAAACSGGADGWPSLDEWGGLLGLLRQNALCAEVAAPLAGLLPLLAAWCATHARGGHAKKRPRKGAGPEEKEAGLLAEALDALPEAAGEAVRASALYPTVACANHSCAPNAEARFVHGTTRLRLVALRNIAAEEEITISYIDENETGNRRERREALRDYRFVCDCSLCLRPPSRGK